MPVSAYGKFDPLSAHTYTIDQLIEFMRNEGISLHEIHTVRSMNMLNFQDYEKLIASDLCTLEDLKAIDVPQRTITDLEDKTIILKIISDEWQRAKASRQVSEVRQFLEDFPDSPFEKDALTLLESLTDEIDWKEARERHTIGAYALYMQDHPKGKHLEEAHTIFQKLEDEERVIRDLMLEDMMLHPWKYPPSIMSSLLNGNTNISPDSRRPENDEHLPPHERFLARGFQLDFDILRHRGVVPVDFTREIVLRPEFSLPQTIDFQNFPLNRTDVFFLGVPRSGKSTVLSSLFYTMYRDGRWSHKVNINPETGVDPSLPYYQGLLRAVQAHKPPESTSTDTISYISMDVPAGENKQHTAHLNFVEISGEAVEKLASAISPGQSGTIVWQELGASNVLANNNSKILFFLLDYNTIRYAEDNMAVLEQELTLNTALSVLTNDGTGKRPADNCTMSKVESVAILLTKADLMGTDNEQERQQLAMEYLNQNFKGFMNELTKCCRQFNINQKNGNLPLIFTFSAGQFYVGNTLEFDDRDARLLAMRIESLAPYKKGGLF